MGAKFGQRTASSQPDQVVKMNSPVVHKMLGLFQCEKYYAYTTSTCTVLRLALDNHNGTDVFSQNQILVRKQVVFTFPQYESDYN